MMNTNAKLALAMAVPAVGMFAGVLMLRGPRVQLRGAASRRRRGRRRVKR
jgi:hypothetical protein